MIMTHNEKLKAAAELIAQVVAECNLECAKAETEEGESIDAATYGITPDTVSMYLDDMPDMVVEVLRRIQPEMLK